jgi:uncharacterized protein (TIGR03067 family)
MTQRIALAAAFGLLLAVASVRAGDQDKFQGTWKAEKMTRGGMDAPAEETEKMTIEFKGNKAIPMKDGKSEDAAEFSLDETKKPKTMDIKPPKEDKTFLGIYELNGDTLKICFARDGGRPEKFESPEGSMNMVIVLKRVKK